MLSGAWEPDVGLRTGRGVSRRVISRNPLRQTQEMIRGFTLSQLFDPFMFVVKPDLEINHRLSRNTESEMAGLNDPRMNRTHRDLENPFSFHTVKNILTRTPRDLRRRPEIFPQRKEPLRALRPVGPGAFRPILMKNQPPGIGMTLRDPAFERGTRRPRPTAQAARR